MYDADHTARGEAAYFVGALLGRRHCGLCDVTHGLLRERADWRACRASLPVGFVAFHRNDQPDAVRAAAGGQAPVVVAETSRGYRLLLDDGGIELCAGSPDSLVRAIDRAVAEGGLAWPNAG